MHTILPQSGQVVIAGRPQMVHKPIIDIAEGEEAADEIKSSDDGPRGQREKGRPRILLLLQCWWDWYVAFDIRQHSNPFQGEAK